MVVEKSPTLSARRLYVHHIVSCLCRIALVDHYCFQAVVAAWCIPLSWLAHLEVQRNGVFHYGCVLTSHHIRSVDLEYKGVLVAVALLVAP